MILQKKNLNFLILYRPQPTTRSFSATNRILIEAKTTLGIIKIFFVFQLFDVKKDAIYGAYGNAATDVEAYLKAGIRYSNLKKYSLFAIIMVVK